MSKGFFFSLSAIMLLIFAVVAITQNLSTVRENELFYSDLIKITSYQTVFSNFNEQSLSTMLGSLGKFALFKMANYSASNPIKPAGEDDYDNFRLVFQDLVNNGNTSSSYFSNPSYPALNYSEDERNFTLSGITNSINESFKSIGYRLNEIKFSNTNISMESPSSLNMTADILINVSDSLCDSSYYITYKGFSASISIEGLPDPLANYYISDAGYKTIGNISRWYMFNHNSDRSVNYNFNNEMGLYRPTERVGSAIVSGSKVGQGWFYGPLISVKDATTNPPQDKGLYVLYGNFTSITTLNKWESYGAYIITSNISYLGSNCQGNFTENPKSVFNPVLWETYGSGCRARTHPQGEAIYTDKPFAVSTTFNATAMIEDSFFDDTNNKTIFFSTPNYPEDVKINPSKKKLNDLTYYGIENIRDQFICSYYYQSSKGPNFMQRTLANGYDLVDNENGLVSMFTEKEFLQRNNNPINQYKDFSSADFEFIGKYKNDPPNSPLYILKGMPGCKSRGMCMGVSSVRRVIASSVVLDDLGLLNNLACSIADKKCWGVE